MNLETFISVGIWWIAFSQIAFRFLPKNISKNPLTNKVIFNGYRELRAVWKTFSNHPILKSYIGAFFVFSMAVQTVLLIAAYFGEQEVSWGSMSEKQTGLIDYSSEQLVLWQFSYFGCVSLRPTHQLISLLYWAFFGLFM